MLFEGVVMQAQRKEILSVTDKMWRVVIFLLMLIAAAFVLYPILYIVFGSFKANQELLMGGIHILPKQFIFSNYVDAWKQANFSRYTFNSFYLAFGVMFLTLLVSSSAGYVFSRANFRFKETLYGIYIAFMFVNVGSVTLRPLFELAVKIHLNTNLISVILIAVGAGQARYIFLCRGFVNSLPKELDEAATIDGCSFFQIYYLIIVPLLKPILATIALLSFRAGWNQYIVPMVFTMSKPNLRPLTVGVIMLKSSGDATAAWNVMFAGCAISIVPILCIYIIANKYFMTGLTSGSVKG